MSASHYGKDKERRAILEQAEAAGWRIRKTTGNHWRCYSPDGKTIITMSSTPSDARSIRAVKADFRRAGLPIK